MAFLADDIFDSGLNVLNTATTTIHITSQEATTRTEATSTYDLGNVSVSIPTATDRTGGGRKVAVPAVTTGSVTATGTAGYYAIVDGTRLLVTGSLSATQSVTSGNTFSLATFDIGIPDPS